MSAPVPPAIKAIFSALSPTDSIALRSYISGLRQEIKDLTDAAKGADDGHAHYHDGVACTADHGHSGHGHEEGEWLGWEAM